MKITISGYVHAVASIILLIYALAEGDTLLLGLSLGLILILYYSYETVKRMKGYVEGISVSRTSDRTVYTELEEATITVRIENKSSINYPRLYIYDDTPRYVKLPGGAASFTIALRPGAVLDVSYRARLMAPGKHVFRDVYIVYSDVFTYFHEAVVRSHILSLTALPLRAPVSFSTGSLNRLIGTYIAGRSTAGLYDLASIREYQPGDDVRKILWKKYASTRKLYMRIDYGEARPRILYMIDVRDDLWNYGLPPNTLSHVQLRAARSILEFLIKAGGRIDAAICVGHVPKVLVEASGDPTEILYEMFSTMKAGEGCRQPLTIYREIPKYVGRRPEEYDLAILITNPYTIHIMGIDQVRELLKTYIDRLAVISPMYEYAGIMGGWRKLKNTVSVLEGLLDTMGRGFIMLGEPMKYKGGF